MKKSDAKMLKALSQHVKETEKNLKAQWKALPGHMRQAERRIILANIETYKKRKMERDRKLRDLPIRL